MIIVLDWLIGFSEEQCHKEEQLIPNDHDQTSAEVHTELTDWIFRISGCVLGLVVGFVIGKIFVTNKHHDWFMETFGRRERSRSVSMKRSAHIHTTIQWISCVITSLIMFFKGLKFILLSFYSILMLCLYNNVSYGVVKSQNKEHLLACKLANKKFTSAL